MNLAFPHNEEKEYATKTEIHYMLHVTYTAIARAIRGGKLAVHLIDGKVQIEVAEAHRVFGRSKPDLFA